MMNIPFNKPYLSGRELDYISKAVANGRTSGNRDYTAACHSFFKQQYGFRKSLLTTSCTDALEMTSILANIQPGDEVILPSFTFVSTANAFALRGAKLVFADSQAGQPNIDHHSLEALVNPKTKAIVPVHYAGVACHMDAIMDLAQRHELLVIEDAAQAIDSFFNGNALGGIGHMAAFSFHETKNIICGEGGMLNVNDPSYAARAEIIWEKGTNRAAFYRGEVDKYGWVDVGSSFLPSDLLAAFLFAQLEHLEQIQSRRKAIWERYYQNLKALEMAQGVGLPHIPEYATNNGHMFYLVCNSLDERSGLIDHLKASGIHAVFHYLSLHTSPYYSAKHDGRHLPQTDRYTDCLLRLPLYYELRDAELDYICEKVLEYYKKR
jgi:dTDP-4-amino-4,6-dideoxygalactose transaminase